MADACLTGKARRVLGLLEREYGRPQPGRDRERVPPLDELIGTILSQNTNDANSGRAFASLSERFGSWQVVMEAPTRRVAAVIRVGGLGQIKAPRIQAVLRQLLAERGELSLDFLSRWPVERAREYLCRFPGVGLKTASCVLLFSLGKPAFPVDTHVLRVSKRLGLLDQRTTMDHAHAELEALVPDRDRFSMHINLIRHGRRICHARKPWCDRCVVRSVCDYYAQLTQ